MMDDKTDAELLIALRRHVAAAARIEAELAKRAKDSN